LKIHLTGPRTAVELDTHAGGLGMNAERYKANTSSYDWRIKLAQLGAVRVYIALEHLHTTWPWRHHSHQNNFHCNNSGGGGENRIRRYLSLGQGHRGKGEAVQMSRHFLLSIKASSRPKC